jgi:hypothetical protein
MIVSRQNFFNKTKILTIFIRLFYLHHKRAEIWADFFRFVIFEVTLKQLKPYELLQLCNTATCAYCTVSAVGQHCCQQDENLAK